MFRTLLITMMLPALLISTGCANKQPSQDQSFDQVALEKATEFSGDSENALIEAEEKHEAAVNTNMGFYAPLHMKQATEALAFAREAELKGLLSDSIIASAKVITLLGLAEETKIKVEAKLQPILQQKKILEELNTPHVLTSQFNDRVEDIIKLITVIEQNSEPVSTSEIDSILADLQQLELGTLLEIHWQPAKDTLEKADDENADKNAPLSFKIAEELVVQAEKDISLNYSNRTLVKEKGIAALRASQHALYVARDAGQLLKLNSQRAEKAVLRFEALLAQIGSTLKAGDLHHMALQDQATALAQKAETQASRLIVPLQKRIIELEEQLKNQGISKNTQPIETDE